MKRSLLLTVAAFAAFGAAAGAFAQSSIPPARQYDPRDSQAQPWDQQAQNDQRQFDQRQNDPRQNDPGYNDPRYDQQPDQRQADATQAAPPARLTIAPGTFVNVRVNQWLSSDRNQQGDAFFGSLASPVVVDGVVVGQRGQLVSGRVSEAVKAGRVQGTSRLGLELTELTLVDGQQVPVQAQMITRNGSTSVGRDAAAIGTTTAVGAAIGAAADLGRGAAIGAGAGAAAGILGVLLTRGNPTVVYPETVMTFRLDRAIDVNTSRSPQAFRYADARDYGRQPAPQYGSYNNAPPPPPRPYYAPGYAPYYGYGPGFSLFVGPGYYRGYYRGYYFRGGRRW